MKTKSITTEQLQNLIVDNEETEIVKILYTLVQSSIQMETAAKKSEEDCV